MSHILQRREEQAEIVKQKLDDLVQADATRLATNKTVATEVGGFGFGARSVGSSCFNLRNVYLDYISNQDQIGLWVQ